MPLPFGPQGCNPIVCSIIGIIKVKPSSPSDIKNPSTHHPLWSVPQKPVRAWLMHDIWPGHIASLIRHCLTQVHYLCFLLFFALRSPFSSSPLCSSISSCLLVTNFIPFILFLVFSPPVFPASVKVDSSSNQAPLPCVIAFVRMGTSFFGPYLYLVSSFS